jgi:hypothetical protein
MEGYGKMMAKADEPRYYREGILPVMPVFPDGVEVYTTTDVHSLARALVRYTEIVKGNPKNVAELIHGGRRGPRVHHPVVLDTLWHFAAVGPQDIDYWHRYVGASLVHHRVVQEAEQLALLAGLPMVIHGCDRNAMIGVLQQIPGIDLNKFEPF